MSKKSFYTLLALDVAMFFITMLLFKRPYLLLGVYVLASFILLTMRRDDWKLFALALVFAFFIESVFVNYGIWSYPGADNFIKVPYWIFLVWGVAGVSCYRFGLYLTGRRV